MKIILNKCFGGFELSPIATMMYAEKKGIVLYPYCYNYRGSGIIGYKYVADVTKVKKVDYFFTEYFGDKVTDKDIDNKSFYYPDRDEIRKDPDLISVVEELGEEANGWCSELVVVDIPDELDGKYVIDDYDGIETLHEDVPVW